MPAQPMPAQPVPGSVTPPQPPHRKNRQYWLGCWRHSGEQTRIRWVKELILEKRSLGRKEKGSIKYRALAPLVTPEMWQEAERLLDSAPPTGPPPTLPISPLAALSFSPLLAPAPVSAPAPALAPSPIFGQWSTFNPGYGVAPVAPTGGFPAPVPAAAQGRIFAPGGFTPNQLPVTRYQQSLPMPQAQAQPRGLFVPTRRHRLDLDDGMEAPQPKRQRSLGPGSTPSRPPPQFMPGVNQVFVDYPGQSSTAYQFSLPVVPQPFPLVAPQLAPQVAPQFAPQINPQFTPQIDPQLTLPFVPQFAPQVIPQFPSSLAPPLAYPVDPQLAPADPLASGWSAQTLPEEQPQFQELNTNDFVIPAETQLGQETQFPPQFGQISNGVPIQSGEVSNEVPIQFGEVSHAVAAAEEADEADTHAVAATEEAYEEDTYAAFVVEDAYGEDTHAAAVVEDAYEGETNVLPNQPQEATIVLPTQSGEEANESLPLEDAQNTDEPQQADTAPAQIDDELPEQQDEATAQEDSEEEVDTTSDRYLYEPLYNWAEYEQQFAS